MPGLAIHAIGKQSRGGTHAGTCREVSVLTSRDAPPKCGYGVSWVWASELGGGQARHMRGGQSAGRWACRLPKAGVVTSLHNAARPASRLAIASIHRSRALALALALLLLVIARRPRRPHALVLASSRG